MEKPLILVTNDDGINAPGIRCLIDVMSEIGEVIVVAPDSPQSGMGHAITINSTLHCSKISPKSSKRLEYSCSGTMSAAIEAGIEGIPAIGFSLLDYRWNANFSDSKKFIKKITLNALKNKIPKDVVLNVNIPTLKESEIKGIKICRQAKSYWVEEFDKRKNPLGQEYYWLTGKFIDKDKGEDTDEWALKNGFISIVPVEFDLTAHSAIKALNQWNFK